MQLASRNCCFRTRSNAMLPREFLHSDEQILRKDFSTVNIRTNNHLEGWHNRLNRKAAKSHNGLYELLQLLIAEQG
ncbi:hypothetical protein T01_2911, partial [Trichinella spiralis]